MMKRLLRKWLKRRVVELHNPFEQQIFEWIYESSIFTWKDKLFCAQNCPDFYEQTYDWLIESK